MSHPPDRDDNDFHIGFALLLSVCLWMLIGLAAWTRWSGA